MKKQSLWTRALGGLVLMVILAFGAPQIAQAGTAVNTSIVNVVKVEYSDANGNGSFTQSASATITVELLAATPDISSPAPASGQVVDSGATQSYAFDFYSNANGPDTYDFDLADGITADSNEISSDKYIASITDPQGNITTYGSGTTSVQNISIGATVITGDNGSDTLYIPAGTGATNGIDSGDFVIINTTVYEIASIADGTPASYDAAGHTLTAEVLGTITLNDQSGNPVSDVTGLTGSTISEYYLINIAVTAVADSLASADAEIYFNLTLTSNSDSNATMSQNDIHTTFTRSQLTISKSANPTSGKPGDTITYTIVISVDGSSASHVVVTDAVPDYTTLTSFATVVYNDGTSDTTVTITPANNDTENSAYASGNTTGTTAGSAITFYLGNGNNGDSNSGNETGGTMAGSETATITYEVTID